MITCYVKNINSLNQKTYNNFIKYFPFHELSCSCGNFNCLTRHAYYTRYIKTVNGNTPISILRVKCNVCNATHAILISNIVPYSHILLDDHVRIIYAYENKSSFIDILNDAYIDESNIKYIIRQYISHFKQKILEHNLLFDQSLVLNCFKYFKCNFMQIKTAFKNLFIHPHNLPYLLNYSGVD